MNVFVISFIVVTCSIAFVTPTTPVLPCVTGTVTSPRPISVTVNDCTALPCTISKSSTVNVKVTFTAVDDAPSLFAVVFAVRNTTVLGAEPINDVCNNLTEGSCPVTKGERVTLSFSKAPISILPLGTGVSAEFVIFDSTNSGTMQACYIVPLNVIAA